MTYTNGATTLHLPRILCLHGGGVNADVFRMQCRAIIARLKSRFRLVFVDGPFLSAPHPEIVAVYGDYGPFRRWLRWQPEHPEVDAETALTEVRHQCQRAMDDDAGTGEWAGLLGFSQGAKIAASLLWTQQRVAERLGAAQLPPSWPAFKFGVLMAGRGPLVVLDSRIEAPPYVASAAEPSGEDFPFPPTNEGDHVLRVPTLHVHGLQDPGLEHHRRLLDKYCQAGTTKLVEWNGAHRLPIKTLDVEAITSKMLELAEEAGMDLGG